MFYCADADADATRQILRAARRVEGRDDPGCGGPLALWARSQRVSNRRLRDATGWRATYPSRQAGWIEVLAALEEVTAVA